METPKKLFVLSLLVTNLAFTTLWAGNGQAHKAQPETDYTRATYPLDTCVVTGDPLDAFVWEGDSVIKKYAVNYVHKEEGKPNRLVRLHSDWCVRDFRKNPEKYLHQIDQAADSKSATETPATKSAVGSDLGTCTRLREVHHDFSPSSLLGPVSTP